MHSELFMLIGGLALLIYSIQAMTESVQYLAGSKFRIWINTFARNRLAAAGLGGLLSIVLSSSSVVTVMLVGLANTRLLTLRQVLAMTLGAIVGSTLIVQIIAFRISEFGLLMVAVGVLFSFLSKTDSNEQVSRGIVFLGLMFFSMSLLKKAGISLQNDELFNYLLNYFKDRPVFSLLMSAVVTAFIQSSAATIAVVMSLMAAQDGNIVQAMPWILGANIGTTATAFIACLEGGGPGKQVALGHLLIKVFGVVLFLPFMGVFGDLVAQLSDNLIRQIAHAHTLFNVVLAVLFFPLVDVGAKVVRRLIPPRERRSPFHFRYLDDQSLSSPELALAQAQREILRLSDTVEKMLRRCIKVFENWDESAYESIREKDQVVDYLNKGIKLYLTKLSQKEMTTGQVETEFMLLSRTNDLESIGDIVEGHILRLAKKNNKKGYTFSKEGWREITAFHQKVAQCLQLSTAFFTSQDRKLGAKLMRLDEEIEETVVELTENHLKRLHKGVKESMDTTSVHLDLIGHLQRISSLSINFATLHKN